MAFLALPLELGGLEARSMFSEEFLVCLREDHPLAASAKISYEDLAGEELFLPERRPSAPSPWYGAGTTLRRPSSRPSSRPACVSWCRRS